MNDPTKLRFAVDLDEIERQMRTSSQPVVPQQPGYPQPQAPQPHPAAPHPDLRSSAIDPLAELARIVGQNDPFDALLASDASRAATVRNVQPISRGAEPQPVVYDSGAYAEGAPTSYPDQFSSVAYQDYPATRQGGGATAQPEMRGFSDDRIDYGSPDATYAPPATHADDPYRRQGTYAGGAYPVPPSSYDQQDSGYAQAQTPTHVRNAQAEAYDTPAPHGYSPRAYGAAYDQEIDDDYDYDHEGYEEERRSRWPFAVAGLVTVLALAGGGYWFMGRSSTDGAGTTPPVVSADAGPTRVQPQTSDEVVIPNQNREIYNQTNPSQPSRVVDREEQPVDAEQVVQQSPQSLQPAGMGGASGQQPRNIELIEPRPVRTFSVRSDGTVIAENGQPVASAQPSPQSFIPPGTVGDSTAPVNSATQPSPSSTTPPPPMLEAAPTLSSSPATSSSATSSSATPSNSSQSAATPGSNIARPPQRPSVQPPASATSGRPLQLQPNVRDIPTLPQSRQTTAAAESNAGDAPQTSQGGSAYAMQIGTAGSEAEARSTYARLQRQHSSELGGRSAMYFRKTDANGATIYRIRIGAGSFSEAQAMCKRYTEAGGECFPTKN